MSNGFANYKRQDGSMNDVASSCVAPYIHNSRNSNLNGSKHCPLVWKLLMKGNPPMEINDKIIIPYDRMYRMFNN